MSEEDCCTPAAHPPLTPSGEELTGSFEIIAGASGSFECYFSYPPSGAPIKGAILLAHDIFGLRTGRHAQLCDELAHEGYVAACPDLFGDGAARAAALQGCGWPIKSFSNLMSLLCCCKASWLMSALRLGWDSDIRPKVVATLEHLQHGAASATLEASAGGTGLRPLRACSVVGFCWGAGIVARMLDENCASRLPLAVACGVAFHPSLRGEEGRTLVANVARPLLLAPAGDDPAPVQPDGELARMLAENDKAGGGEAASSAAGGRCVVPFPEMLHGWMTRGPLSDEAIKRDYAVGLHLLLGFVREKMLQ
jgi:dienelactone hydrolase